MGHCYTPAYANICMSKWEREALSKCKVQPSFYFCFLDDIISEWPHRHDTFLEFTWTLNNHHPSIKIKYTIGEQEVNFLDTTFRILTPHTNTYSPKFTSKPQKRTHSVKSQIIQFHRLSSTDLQEAITTLFSSLRQRGYSTHFLRSIKNSMLASLPPTHSNAAHGCPPRPINNQSSTGLRQWEKKPTAGTGNRPNVAPKLLHHLLTKIHPTPQ